MCGECESTDADNSINFSSLISLKSVILSKLNADSVRVPVLSNITVSSFAVLSMISPPRKTIPLAAALPMPAKYVRGTDNTKEQGQETTSTIIAALIHPTTSPVVIAPIAKIQSATLKAIGVNIAANLVIFFSTEDFLLPACSTATRIRITTESSCFFIVLKVTEPSVSKAPDGHSTPSYISRGFDSPVTLEVSALPAP